MQTRTLPVQSRAAELSARIEERTAVVLIIGLGYVGLPLALTFTEQRFRVLGFDVDSAKVDALARGEVYIKHLDPSRVGRAIQSGGLHSTADFSRLSEPDVLIICVPTPLTIQREPDMSYVVETVGAIRQQLRPGQLVVLESTTYPGTTEELVQGILEKSGLRCGEEFFLAFSPEREDPGNANYGTATIPKVVSGVDGASGDLAQALYDRIVSKTVRVSSCRAAEATKLTENIFRAVNIALVNELKVVYDRMGTNTTRAGQSANSEAY
jgi:UDP-N-acetyl-D-glucosamine dehydrogenase